MPYVGDTFVVTEKWSCSFRCTANPQALVLLQHAMRENPSLQIMITNEYFDFATPYFGTRQAIKQLEPDLRLRVSITYYKAGHLLPPEYREDVARFIQGVSVIPKKSENVHAQSAQ
jgi:carboxypeptidase C (cathepsin A)